MREKGGHRFHQNYTVTFKNSLNLVLSRNNRKEAAHTDPQKVLFEFGSYLRRRVTNCFC